MADLAKQPAQQQGEAVPEIADASNNASDPGTLEKEPVQRSGQDIGEDLYREIANWDPDELEAERVHVLRLIDWRIMPIVRANDAFPSLNFPVSFTSPFPPG
jgi:hypothetical protein